MKGIFWEKKKFRDMFVIYDNLSLSTDLVDPSLRRAVDGR